jgi:hypothetical protein
VAINDFDRGMIAGILIGEGHFGGDGRQPQVTLRMHVRHESLFKWLQARLPGARLYGPYEHSGRRYYQWMARGEVLVRDVLPIVEAALAGGVDAHVSSRVDEMRSKYADFFAAHEA